MTNTNVTNFRKNLFEYINQAVEFNDVINVNTKKGNAIVMSEEEYNSLIETLHLTSNPEFVKEIKDSLQEPLDDMVFANLHSTMVRLKQAPYKPRYFPELSHPKLSTS